MAFVEKNTTWNVGAEISHPYTDKVRLSVYGPCGGGPYNTLMDLGYAKELRQELDQAIDEAQAYCK